MVLEDRSILDWAKSNVHPFDIEMVNPASLDMRLGNQIRVPMWYWNPVLWRLAYRLNLPKWSEPKEFKTYLLKPGQFVLCHSLETTRIPDDVATQLLLKSSTARRGIQSLYAGFGDPGFGDNDAGGASWTFELVNSAPFPVLLEAGKPIMQLILYKMVNVPDRLYKQTGRYNNQVGPTPARK